MIVNVLGAAICVYVHMHRVFGYFLLMLMSKLGGSKSREFIAAPGEEWH